MVISESGVRECRAEDRGSAMPCSHIAAFFVDAPVDEGAIPLVALLVASLVKLVDDRRSARADRRSAVDARRRSAPEIHPLDGRVGRRGP